MRFDVLTLFPEFFDGPLKASIVGRAIDKGVIGVRIHNIRDHATDKHRTTDDYPYGGGSGMVLKPEPVVSAIETAVGDRGNGGTLVVLSTPAGEPFTHKIAVELSTFKKIVIVCGRYEGVDERVKPYVDREVSIGDYVLTGGEIPALVVIDAVARLLPGALGSEGSAGSESFADGLLEYPHYTRPEVFRNERVPDVLLSGNHEQIRKWRRKESLKKTLATRPDLLEADFFGKLDKEDLQTLNELKYNLTLLSKANKGDTGGI